MQICAAGGLRVKRCAACDRDLTEIDGWTCGACGFAPVQEDGILKVSELPGSAVSYDPVFFDQVTAVREKNFWICARNELIVWLVNEYFPRAESMIEVGCGTGVVLSALRGAIPHLRLTGTEPFASAAIAARGRLPEVELMACTLRQVPFREEFDLAGCFDVLEHIECDEDALTQLRRLVRPGGGAIISVPQHRVLWSHVDSSSGHYRRYSRGEFVGKLQRTGWSVVDVMSFTSVLFPAMWLSRRLTGGGRAGPELDMIAPLNTILLGCLRAERLLLRLGVRLPFGGSLVAVARRDG